VSLIPYKCRDVFQFVHSQNELARIVEMSLANIQKIERNKAKSIPLDTLDRLCEVLNCEVGDWLVRVSDRELEAS
jgi:putative transcriptional regulator